MIGCNSSTIIGVMIAKAKMFRVLILFETKGKKNPIGKNMIRLPSSIVLTQRPIVNSPVWAFKNVGTKLKLPENSGSSSPPL